MQRDHCKRRDTSSTTEVEYLAVGRRRCNSFSYLEDPPKSSSMKIFLLFNLLEYMAKQNVQSSPAGECLLTRNPANQGQVFPHTR
jgi:hypothetical protein